MRASLVIQHRQTAPCERVVNVNPCPCAELKTPAGSLAGLTAGGFFF